MQSKTMLIVFFAFLFFLPGIAGAIEGDLTRKGWFLGAGGTWAIHLFEDEVEKAVGDLANVNNAWGLNARFGYRFNKWVAAELEYEYVSGFDVEFLGLKIMELEGHTWTVNGKFYYPIEQFQPYLILGLGTSYYRVKDKTGLGENFSTDTDLSGRVGIGWDIYFLENWLLYQENSAVLSTLDVGNISGKSSLSDLHYWSIQLGVQYRF